MAFEDENENEDEDEGNTPSCCSTAWTDRSAWRLFSHAQTPPAFAPPPHLAARRRLGARLEQGGAHDDRRDRLPRAESGGSRGAREGPGGPAIAPAIRAVLAKAGGGNAGRRRRDDAPHARRTLARRRARPARVSSRCLALHQLPLPAAFDRDGETGGRQYRRRAGEKPRAREDRRGRRRARHRALLGHASHGRRPSAVARHAVDR